MQNLQKCKHLYKSFNNRKRFINIKHYFSKNRYSNDAKSKKNEASKDNKKETNVGDFDIFASQCHWIRPLQPGESDPTHKGQYCHHMMYHKYTYLDTFTYLSNCRNPQPSSKTKLVPPKPSNNPGVPPPRSFIKIIEKPNSSKSIILKSSSTPTVIALPPGRKSVINASALKSKEVFVKHTGVVNSTLSKKNKESYTDALHTAKKPIITTSKVGVSHKKDTKLLLNKQQSIKAKELFIKIFLTRDTVANPELSVDNLVKSKLTDSDGSLTTPVLNVSDVDESYNQENTKLKKIIDTITILVPSENEKTKVVNKRYSATKPILLAVRDTTNVDLMPVSTKPILMTSKVGNDNNNIPTSSKVESTKKTVPSPNKKNKKELKPETKSSFNTNEMKKTKNLEKIIVPKKNDMDESFTDTQSTFLSGIDESNENILNAYSSINTGKTENIMPLSTNVQKKDKSAEILTQSKSNRISTPGGILLPKTNNSFMQSNDANRTYLSNIDETNENVLSSWKITNQPVKHKTNKTGVYVSQEVFVSKLDKAVKNNVVVPKKIVENAKAKVHKTEVTVEDLNRSVQSLLKHSQIEEEGSNTDTKLPYANHSPMEEKPPIAMSLSNFAKQEKENNPLEDNKSVLMTGVVKKENKSQSALNESQVEEKGINTDTNTKEKPPNAMLLGSLDKQKKENIKEQDEENKLLEEYQPPIVMKLKEGKNKSLETPSHIAMLLESVKKKVKEDSKETTAKVVNKSEDQVMKKMHMNNIASILGPQSIKMFSPEGQKIITFDKKNATFEFSTTKSKNSTLSNSKNSQKPQQRSNSTNSKSSTFNEDTKQIGTNNQKESKKNLMSFKYGISSDSDKKENKQIKDKSSAVDKFPISETNLDFTISLKILNIGQQNSSTVIENVTPIKKNDVNESIKSVTSITKLLPFVTISTKSLNEQDLIPKSHLTYKQNLRSTILPNPSGFSESKTQIKSLPTYCVKQKTKPFTQQYKMSTSLNLSKSLSKTKKKSKLSSIDTVSKSKIRLEKKKCTESNNLNSCATNFDLESIKSSLIVKSLILSSLEKYWITMKDNNVQKLNKYFKYMFSNSDQLQSAVEKPTKSTDMKLNQEYPLKWKFKATPKTSISKLKTFTNRNKSKASKDSKSYLTKELLKTINSVQWINVPIRKSKELRDNINIKINEREPVKNKFIKEEETIQLNTILGESIPLPGAESDLLPQVIALSSSRSEAEDLIINNKLDDSKSCEQNDKTKKFQVEKITKIDENRILTEELYEEKINSNIEETDELDSEEPIIILKRKIHIKSSNSAHKDEQIIEPIIIVKKKNKFRKNNFKKSDTENRTSLKEDNLNFFDSNTITDENLINQLIKLTDTSNVETSILITSDYKDLELEDHKVSKNSQDYTKILLNLDKMNMSQRVMTRLVSLLKTQHCYKPIILSIRKDHSTSKNSGLGSKSHSKQRKSNKSRQSDDVPITKSNKSRTYAEPDSLKWKFKPPPKAPPLPEFKLLRKTYIPKESELMDETNERESEPLKEEEYDENKKRKSKKLNEFNIIRKINEPPLPFSYKPLNETLPKKSEKPSSKEKIATVEEMNAHSTPELKDNKFKAPPLESFLKKSKLISNSKESDKTNSKLEKKTTAKKENKQNSEYMNMKKGKDEKILKKEQNKENKYIFDKLSEDITKYANIKQNTHKENPKDVEQFKDDDKETQEEEENPKYKEIFFELPPPKSKIIAPNTIRTDFTLEKNEEDSIQKSDTENNSLLSKPENEAQESLFTKTNENLEEVFQEKRTYVENEDENENKNEDKNDLQMNVKSKDKQKNTGDLPFLKKIVPTSLILVPTENEENEVTDEMENNRESNKYSERLRIISKDPKKKQKYIDEIKRFKKEMKYFNESEEIDESEENNVELTNSNSESTTDSFNNRKQHIKNNIKKTNEINTRIFEKISRKEEEISANNLTTESKDTKAEEYLNDANNNTKENFLSKIDESVENNIELFKSNPETKTEESKFTYWEKKIKEMFNNSDEVNRKVLDKEIRNTFLSHVDEYIENINTDIDYGSPDFYNVKYKMGPNMTQAEFLNKIIKFDKKIKKDFVEISEVLEVKVEKDIESEQITPVFETSKNQKEVDQIINDQETKNIKMIFEDIKSIGTILPTEIRVVPESLVLTELGESVKPSEKLISPKKTKYENLTESIFPDTSNIKTESANLKDMKIVVKVGIPIPDIGKIEEKSLSTKTHVMSTNELFPNVAVETETDLRENIDLLDLKNTLKTNSEIPNKEKQVLNETLDVKNLNIANSTETKISDISKNKDLNKSNKSKDLVSDVSNVPNINKNKKVNNSNSQKDLLDLGILETATKKENKISSISKNKKLKTESDIQKDVINLFKHEIAMKAKFNIPMFKGKSEQFESEIEKELLDLKNTDIDTKSKDPNLSKKNKELNEKSNQQMELFDIKKNDKFVKTKSKIAELSKTEELNKKTIIWKDVPDLKKSDKITEIKTKSQNISEKPEQKTSSIKKFNFKKSDVVTDTKLNVPDLSEKKKVNKNYKEIDFFELKKSKSDITVKSDNKDINYKSKVQKDILDLNKFVTPIETKSNNSDLNTKIEQNNKMNMKKEVLNLKKSDTLIETKPSVSKLRDNKEQIKKPHTQKNLLESKKPAIVIERKPEILDLNINKEPNKNMHGENILIDSNNSVLDKIKSQISIQNNLLDFSLADIQIETKVAVSDKNKKDNDILPKKSHIHIKSILSNHKHPDIFVAFIPKQKRTQPDNSKSSPK